MNINRFTGGDLLKEGTKHLTGLEQAVIRNIDAVRDLSELTRTSLGPCGLNKMVIASSDKLYVTHDAVAMLKEVEVVHPAAKLVVMACQSQESEVGDGSNFVLSFAGELLHQAEELIRVMKLHPSEIISGYKKALAKAVEILEKSVIASVSDLSNKEQVCKGLRAGISAKQYDNEAFLTSLIADACINALPKKNSPSGVGNNAKSFSVDNVRTLKAEGGSLQDSFLIRGFALSRQTEGQIHHVKGAKIVCFACNIDLSSLDSKEKVTLKSAEELLGYSKKEEQAIEEDIKAIASSGANVICTTGSFGEMAMHFIERSHMMAVKVPSKFDMRRLCAATGATPLVRIGKPLPEELGSCQSVDVKEVGSTKILVFDVQEEDQQHQQQSKISTIVIRGPTGNYMDEVERCIDDGVNIFKTLTRDSRLVGGCGAVEVELCRGVAKFADESSGMDQYAIRKFGDAFSIIPRTIAESAGLTSAKVFANLLALHEQGKTEYGVDILSPEGRLDVLQVGLFDAFLTKYYGIKLATAAVLNILSIDQIIMARPAGGPKLPKQQGSSLDADDDA
jgi:T-complex protein 1 subunit theta